MIACWRDMETERGIGMDVGPIPWGSVVRWAEVHELDRSETQLLTQVIRKLDADFLAERAHKRKHQE